MTLTQIPEQYAFLFRLLRDSSAAYTDELAKLAGNYGDTWNPHTARFEVDAYLAFQLSSSLLNLEHNREVWHDMCYLCEAALTKIHEESITSGNLSTSSLLALRVTGGSLVEAPTGAVRTLLSSNHFGSTSWLHHMMTALRRSIP